MCRREKWPLPEAARSIKTENEGTLSMPPFQAFQISENKGAEDMRNGGELKLISGNANKDLAEEIARVLGVTLARTHVGHFSDGEIEVKILDNVRGTDCFVVQPTCPPVNENLME